MADARAVAIIGNIKRVRDPIFLSSLADLRALGGLGYSMLAFITGDFSMTVENTSTGWFLRDDNDLVTPDDGLDVIVSVDGRRWKRLLTNIALIVSYTNAAQASADAANNSAISADADAASALASKLSANASEVASADYLSQTKVARDDALISSGIYGSVAEGLAATVSGQHFDVPVDNLYQDLIRYKNSAGGATEVFRHAVATGMLKYYGINTRGETDIRPDVLSTDSAKIGWYEVLPGLMFQDRFGQTPVTATGQLVGLVVPINAEPGPAIIGAGPATFTSAVGWTVGAGWAINTAGVGKAVATAAGGVLQFATGLNATKKYRVDVSVQGYVGGTLQVDVGAGFTNVPITANGIYRLYIQCGGAPTGGLYLRAVGFTGEVDFAQIAEATPWLWGPGTDAERGTYQIDANGAPYIDAPTGKHYKTNSIIQQVLPSYMCIAMGRAATSTFTMFVFGYLSFQDTGTQYLVNGGSALAGQFATPGLRGSLDLTNPVVQDLYLEAGFTSGYANNGNRKVIKEVALASNADRYVPNTFTGAETQTTFFGMNYTSGGITTANSRFYGGVIANGVTISEVQRRKVIEHFQNIGRLSILRDYEYDLYGFAGQSNMMGVGNLTTSVAPAFGNGAEYVDAGYIRALRDPCQHALPSQYATSGCMIPAFGAAHFTRCGRRVLAVGNGASGVGLVNTTTVTYGNWLTGLYPKMLGFKFRNAMKDVRCIPRGIVYLGGEQDATLAISQAAYEVLLIQLRDKFRLETGIPTLPLLIVSLDDTTGSPPQYAVMRAAMNNVSMNGVGATNPTEGIYLIVGYQNYLAAGLLIDGIHRGQPALNNDGNLGGIAAADLFSQ